MKVFVTKRKDTDEVKNELVEKVDFIKICKNEKFNCITIKNPEDSNTICMLRGMEITSEEKDNKLRLIQGEDEFYRGEIESSKEYKIGIFNVKSELQIYNNNRNIELTRNTLLRNQKCNVLNDLELIILPKGCIYIKLDEEVCDFNIKINWTSEEIA
ncbi:hypothetical protein OW763_11525 [Clostridium aestuarii]|uniref:DUF1934 domain-containing protein n=1 Tax=Clostridium aestuarii TaxID=338193 RepID=A0ABT4D4K2_9CLOT|nr:hypothetical protein [Clostridium aestuarii]MCY6484973.1 hypothetical protein [Clostridium aestuarii]